MPFISSSNRSLLPFFFVLFLLSLFLNPVASQTITLESTQKQAAPDADLSSASSTMRTFLLAFPDPAFGREDKIDPMAIKTLEMPMSDTITKVNQAKILKQIIDRTRFVDLKEIDESVGENTIYDFAVYNNGRIQLEKQENGNWLFNKRTIESLDGIWFEVKHRPIVDGITSTPGLTLSQEFEETLPEELQERIFFLEVWKWLGILIVISIGVFADKVVVYGLVLFVLAIMKRAKAKGDRDQIYQAVRPLGILAMAGVFKIGLLILLLPVTLDVILNVVVRFLAAMSIVWAAYKAVDGLSVYMKKFVSSSETHIDDLLIPFFSKVMKIFIALFGMVFIASQLNINIASLLAGLGLGGLAFALAAKDTVENFFGSITVLVDQPFRVGDWIVMESGAEGEVETVGLRSTRIRTFYNSVITVPNSRLINSTVDNYGMREFRRWKTTLTVTYDTPPEKIEAFCQGLRELILSHPNTRKDKFFVYVNEFGAYSLDVLFYIFFIAPDWETELRARHSLFLEILRLAKSLGVEFAFPTQTHHVAGTAPAHEDNPESMDLAATAGIVAARQILSSQRSSTSEVSKNKIN